jgi:hypothetical protein
MLIGCLRVFLLRLRLISWAFPPSALSGSLGAFVLSRAQPRGRFRRLMAWQTAGGSENCSGLLLLSATTPTAELTGQILPRAVPSHPYRPSGAHGCIPRVYWSGLEQTPHSQPSHCPPRPKSRHGCTAIFLALDQISYARAPAVGMNLDGWLVKRPDWRKPQPAMPR